MSSSVHLLTDKARVLGLTSTATGVSGNFPLDENVIAELPQGTIVNSANTFGTSAWTVTARIDTIGPDGNKKTYFLKVATENGGKAMMEGELNAMKEIYKTIPSLVPKPITWGKFKLETIDTYFFLCDFVDMDNRLPNPARLGSQIAELHRTSVSPTGKFGFYLPTCHGKYPQFVEWDDNWASFFAKLLADALRLDIENNGHWPELEKVSERTLAKVIPRLLGVLQTEGRELKPCLIHGDLWEGNIGIVYENNEIKIFDSGAYYAHNEMEIGMWRCVRHKINAKAFTRQYLKYFPPSEPVEEWDDRNRIYCVKMNMIHSAHHAGDIVRQTAYEDMCYLVDKYAPWDQEEENEKES